MPRMAEHAVQNVLRMQKINTCLTNFNSMFLFTEEHLHTSARILNFAMKNFFVRRRVAVGVGSRERRWKGGKGGKEGCDVTTILH